MANYIDRDKIELSRLKDPANRYLIELLVFNLPIEDVAPVKHGKWQQNQYHQRIYYCSECGRHIEDGSNKPYEHFPYCHCGAKMDLED